MRMIKEIREKYLYIKLTYTDEEARKASWLCFIVRIFFPLSCHIIKNNDVTRKKPDTNHSTGIQEKKIRFHKFIL